MIKGVSKQELISRLKQINDDMDYLSIIAKKNKKAQKKKKKPKKSR